MANDHNFYEGNIPSQIYSYFQKNIQFHDIVQKPTRKKKIPMFLLPERIYSPVSYTQQT